MQFIMGERGMKLPVYITFSAFMWSPLNWVVLSPHVTLHSPPSLFPDIHFLILSPFSATPSLVDFGFFFS